MILVFERQEALHASLFADITTSNRSPLLRPLYFMVRSSNLEKKLRIFLFPRTSITALDSSQFDGCQGSFPRLRDREVKLITCLHLVPWLRICGAILLPPLYAFMAWAATLYLLSLPLLTGNAVTQLVDALRYKSEGRGFDSRWCHWNISLT